MSKTLDTVDILKLPYAERQLIAVFDDEVVKATRKGAETSKDGMDGDDLKSVAARVAKEALRYTVFGTLINITDALTAWVQARQNGLNVLQVGRSEAAHLQFPPGHPRDQALYVAHPAKPSVYYTMASFHRMAFEHKFAEAITLLMSLGATQIEVEHVQGWDRKFTSQMSVPLQAIDAGLHASKSAGTQSSLLFKATFDNKQNTSVPEGLVWFAHEPTWQALADGRTRYGMNEFSLAVNYEDDFGVNAGLKLQAQKAGLDIGGTFENHVATTWKIYGKFGRNL
jgi:hypothetical protein